MKKITTLFFLFVIVLSITSKDNTKLVSSELTLNKNMERKFCYITTHDNLVTTKNIVENFENINIISISPYINPVYKDRLNSRIGTYFFTEDSIENNVLNFTHVYLDTLKKETLIEDMNAFYMQGIPIEQLKVFCDDKTLSKVKNMPYKAVIRNN